MDKPRVHYNDVKLEKVQADYWLAPNGKKYYDEEQARKENCTVVPCTQCGEDVKAKYVPQLCDECRHRRTSERFNSLEVVEWDGKTPLVLFGDDQYFFDEDDLEWYCEDHEVEPSELMLCICEKTIFRTIDCDYFVDDVHDDWEPSPKLQEAMQAFNKVLEEESTETWFQSNKRIIWEGGLNG